MHSTSPADRRTRKTQSNNVIPFPRSVPSWTPENFVDFLGEGEAVTLIGEGNSFALIDEHGRTLWTIRRAS